MGLPATDLPEDTAEPLAAGWSTSEKTGPSKAALAAAVLLTHSPEVLPPD